MLKYFFLFLFFPSIVYSIQVKNIELKNYQNNAPFIVYLSIENDSKIIDYLLGVEVVNQPSVVAKINKSFIEQGVARNVQIDRLAIPPNSKVDLNALGIYIILYRLENGKDPIQLKLRFNSGDVSAFAFSKE